jgi:serine/threonine protein kinase/WD40 repeat protein
MNRPHQPADEFDPDKTVPEIRPTKPAAPPQSFEDLSATLPTVEQPAGDPGLSTVPDPDATILETADSDPARTQPAADEATPEFQATMLTAPEDEEQRTTRDRDAEDVVATQIEAPNPNLTATLVQNVAEDPDQTSVESTRAWSPSLDATQTMSGVDKFLLDEADSGAAATVPGKLSAGESSAARPPRPKPAPSGGSAGGSTPGSSRNIGKSSWNLHIHSRAVAGEISGIINPPPSRTSGLQGLESAMARNQDVPEYEVLGKLGNGAMGIVYRALQTSLNREMAIKTLRGDVANPRLAQEMFVSEAVITANLVHPNIIPIHDLGRNAEGKLFYSMKQIHGREWRKVMKTLSLEENLDILLKVCDAVAYAHSRGVINRDLKPENVVIGSYGEVVVLDWGLAVTMPDFLQRESVLTDIKGGAGSPAYMAPELLDADPSGVCRQSDVYLLGGMLYEILEGFPPHLLFSIRELDTPRRQMQAVIAAVANNQIEENTKHRGELMQIARRAMATKPEDRFQTVEDLQDAIREYRITGRAEELLEKARAEKTTGYDYYQQAVALFTDALSKWPANERATRGDLEAREAFAELARTKGDFDLGLEVLSSSTEPKLVKLAARLKREKFIRTVVRTTWMVLFAAVAVMLVVSVRLLVRNNVLNEDNRQLENKRSTLVRQNMEKEQELKKKEKEILAKTAEAEQAVKRTAEAAQNQMRAEQAAMQAAMLAEQAQRDAQQAQKKAAEDVLVARRQADEAEAQRTKTINDSRRQQAVEQVRTLVNRIESGYELRDYARVLELGQEAAARIRSMVDDPLFLDERQWLQQQERSLQDKLDRARRIQGTGQAAFPDNQRPVLSAVSGDGRTFAVLLNPDEAAENRRIRFFQRRDADQSLSDASSQLELPVTETRRLILSRSGNAACLIGPAVPFVWVRKDSQHWKQVTLDVPATNEDEPLRMLQAHFSDNEQRLYLIGDDRAATLQIFDLSSDSPRPLLADKTTLFLPENANYRCSHSVLLPDESCLLVCSQTGRDHQLRAFQLRWTDGVPQLGEQGPGRKVPVLTGLNSTLNGVPLPGDAAIRLLQTSPNGQRLLVGFERPGQNLLLLLNRRSGQSSESAALEFPFHAPDSPVAAEHCQLLMAATEKLPTAVRFSPDGTVLAALLKLNRSNLQFWKQQTDGAFTDLASAAVPAEPAADSGLEQIDRGDGRTATLLPGHASPVQDLAFLNDSGTKILAIDSRALFHWDFGTLNDYRGSLDGLRMAASELLQELEQKLLPPAAQPQAFHNPAADVDPRLRSNVRGRFLFTGLQEASAAADESVPDLSGSRRVTRGTAIYSAEFSPDNRLILAGADDLAAHVLDADDVTKPLSMSNRPDVLRFTDQAAGRTTTVNYLLEGHGSSISSLRFLPPDGRLLLTSDNLGAISVWDAWDDEDGVGRERARLLPFYSSSDLTVSVDGAWILIGGAHRAAGTPAANAAAFEYSGLLYRSADLERQLAPQPVLELRGGHFDAPITATAISADATLAVTADRSGRVAVWSLPDGRLVATVSAAHDGDRVSSAAFLAPREFLTAGYDGRIVRWKLSEDSQLQASAVYRGQQILRMEISPDKSFAALLEVEFVENEKPRQAADGNSFLVCRSLPIPRNAAVDQAAVRQLVRLQLDNSSIEVPQTSGLAWTADGHHLLLMIRNELSIHRTSDGQRIRRLKSGDSAAAGSAGHASQHLALAGLACAADSDGGLRIATSSGRQAQLWKLPAIQSGNGRLLASLSTHHSRQLTASFSADQKYVLTASDALRIFSTDGGMVSEQAGRTVLRLADPNTHRYPLTSAGFSPASGDLRFFSCDSSGLVRLWNWDGSQLPQSTVIAEGLPESEWPAWARQFNIASAATKASWNQNAQCLSAVLRGRIRCWKLTDQGLQTIPLPLPEQADFLFNDVTFSGTSDVLAAAGLAWDRQSRKVQYAACVWRLNTDHTAVLAAALLDADSEPEASGKDQECGGLTAIHLDPAESVAITGAQDGRVRTWRLPELDKAADGSFVSAVDIEDRIGTGRSARTITHSSRITSIDLSANRQLLTADDEGQLIVWSKAVYGNRTADTSAPQP